MAKATEKYPTMTNYDQGLAINSYIFMQNYLLIYLEIA